jgi:hypothetical protein
MKTVNDLVPCPRNVKGDDLLDGGFDGFNDVLYGQEGKDPFVSYKYRDHSDPLTWWFEYEGVQDLNTAQGDKRLWTSI